MDWLGWAVFGFAGTVALTTISTGAQLAGWTRMDLPLMLGTMFVDDPDRARVAGFFVHVVNGQVFALIYVGAFSAIGFATWWLGALFGLFHGIAALTILMPLLPGIHPRMAGNSTGPEARQTLEPPGLLGLHYGTQTPFVTLLAHIIFGLILGAFLRL